MSLPSAPKRWCYHDHCCEFYPGAHNAAYCLEHKCYRKAEAARKRLNTTVVEYDEETWQLEENRKLGRAIRAQQKNDWILKNKSIAMFDIETTNLDASIGEILCASIKPLGGKIESWASTASDEDLSNAVARRLEGFDYVVTFYGTGFDIKFINTRLMVGGHRPIDMLRHIDVYYVARSVLKLHSNRLAVVAETLFGESGKTRILGPTWTRAARGDTEAMAYIIDHCEKDVVELEAVFNRLKGFINFSAVKVSKYGGSGNVGLV